MLCQERCRGSLGKVTGRRASKTFGYCDCANGRAARCLLATAVTIASLMALVTPLHAQGKSVPIPRPSPLAQPDPAVPPEPAAPEAVQRPAGPGLSPGALLDPTNNGSTRLNFSSDAIGDPDIAPAVNVGNQVPLGPSAPAVAGPSVGNNPLLGMAPPTATEVRYYLEARLKPDGLALPAGVTWRIFGAHPGPDNRLPFIGEAGGGAIDVRLTPGDYLVHAAYGRAGATKKISVDASGGRDTVIINGGGLKLSAFVGKNDPLSSADVSFDVYAPDEDGSDERVLLVSDAPPDQIIGLNAGIYHIICRYGDANAVVRADIRVEAGNLTEATVYQKAARLTLKLVSEHGGEALANTSWFITTSEGDNIVESVGAFPSVVLAAGDYTAVASHQGRRFERKFTVEAGLHRDVEVLAK